MGSISASFQHGTTRQSLDTALPPAGMMQEGSRHPSEETTEWEESVFTNAKVLISGERDK